MAATQPTNRASPVSLGRGLLAGYLVLYAGFLLAMRHSGNFDISEPLLVLAIVGVGFSLVAWLVTARATPLAYSIGNPVSELAVVGAFLLVAVAFITWGLPGIQRYFPYDPAHAIAILVAKLAVFVILPAATLRAQFGWTWRRLVPISVQPSHLAAATVMSVLLLAFQAVLGRGLRDISVAHLPAATLLYGVPLTFVWMAVEAGVVEEFFFRVLLQGRLAAVLKSELGAVVLSSLIFGLAHAPGIYLRTSLTQEGLHNPSLLMAIGYSVVMISVTGFFLGVLWARTRNFGVLVVVHAMGDLLPNLLPTLRALHLLG